MRTHPPGVDNYYFLLNARHGIIVDIMPPIFQYLALATDGYGWIILPAMMALVSTIMLSLIGKEMRLNNWEMAGLALLLTPIFFFRSAIFEDDILAYPLMLVSVYLFLKNKWLGLGSSILIVFFWKGWFLITAMLLFFILPEILAAGLLLAIGIYTVVTHLNGGVAELLPMSIGVLFVFYPFVDQIARQIKQDISKYDYCKITLKRWLVFSLGLAMVASRFLIFAVFPLALLYVHYSGWKQKGTIVQGFTIALLISSIVIVAFAMPDPIMMKCIKDNPDATVDWSLGYYKQWFHNKSNYSPLQPKNMPDDYKPDIRYEFWRDDCYDTKTK